MVRSERTRQLGEVVIRGGQALVLALVVAGAATAAHVAAPSQPGGIGSVAASSCAGPRRAVGTLADRPRLRPLRATTVASLARRRRPRRVRIGRMPFERHVFRVSASVTAVKRTGSELRLVLRSGAAHMVAVAPSPLCAAKASRLRRLQMKRARAAVRTCKAAIVTGVAFWDRRRGQAGAAANGIALRPILGFRCPLIAAPPPPPPAPPPPPHPPPPPPPPPRDVVIAAAGDIACDPADSSFNSGSGTSEECRQRWTANLLASINPEAVLPLGDNQYYCGGFAAFMGSYNLSWGAFKSITHPSVGNHEYLTSGGTDCNSGNAGANGYFTYFGAAAGQRGQGYYSYNLGSWHLIVLNSNCSDAGGCNATSPQGRWLANDLATHTNFCTLAYWHIPLFSSGGRANNNSRTFWDLLYDHNADLILNGHDHIYERFAPQDPDGDADTQRGIREIIAGTGGANHTSIASVAANSEVRNTDTFGVLKLTLHPTSYSWQFVPEAGQTFTDSGSNACH